MEIPPGSPIVVSEWTFASLGWTRHESSEHFYIPGKRFKSIAAGAFNVMAITAPTTLNPAVIIKN